MLVAILELGAHWLVSPMGGIRMKTRALLVDLRFQTEVARYTDQQPGYHYDFGNLVLHVSQVTNEYLRQTMLFTGTAYSPRSIGSVEFSLPLDVESYEQGVALIAYNIGQDFKPTRPTPWLLLGRMWEEHLPGRRELRLFQQRPQCNVEADWFRVAVKKLMACGENAAEGAYFSVSFAGNVLTVALPDQQLVMPATGKDWPQAYQCLASGLRHLPRRTPSIGVSVSIWDGCLTIGRLQLPVQN
jgi:hypothetical protein